MQQCVQRAPVIRNVRNFFVSPCDCDKEGENGNNSNCGGDENDSLKFCVCHVVTPIIRLCQIFGVFPVTFHQYSTKSTTTTTGKVGSLGQLYRFRQQHDCTKDIKNGIIEGVATKKECQISSRWISIPSLINILLLLGYIGISAWTFSHMNVILTVYFEGTDLYTFGTQTICLYTQSNLILFNALIQREKFCEIWSLLLKILKRLTQKPIYKLENDYTDSSNGIPFRQTGGTKALHNFVVASTILHHLEYNKNNKCTPNHESNQIQQQANTIPLPSTVENNNDNKVIKRGYKLRRRFKVLRIFSICCLLHILILSISHNISFFNLVFNACFDKTADPGINVVFGKPPCPLSNVVLLFQKCFYGMIDFVTQGVALLFGTLCLLIFIFFKEFQEQLESLFKSFAEISNRPAVICRRQYEVQNLRLCYEDLSALCRLMSKCFGLAIISVLITSVVSLTCALYSFALYSGAISKYEKENMLRFYVIWAFHGWFGVFCLILVLIPGQLITNASEAPSQIIGRHAISHLDKETKYQLSQFQYQCRQPIILSACNVANVGLGFISAAATNVTTYILVILQFRLGVEK